MRKKCFINPHVKLTRHGFKDFLLWKLGYFEDECEELLSNVSLPRHATGPSSIEGPTVTWINHSTFLIQFEGVNILTDPIWSKRCSPVSFIGPKRRHPPGIPFSELPDIHIVLISHDHYDHLDAQTVLNLSRRFAHASWFVPKGVKRWFDKRGIVPVYDFDWWDARDLTLPSHPGIIGKITAVPAQHFSGRRGYDYNNTLWVGWVLEFNGKSKSKRCYFVGDTGYNPFDFKKIGECFAPIDLSLIPIGSYQPRAFMENVHVSPKESVLIHQEVGSLLSIGMHWKTFKLSDEPVEQPPFDLYRALIKEQLNPSKFIVLDPGHAINW